MRFPGRSVWIITACLISAPLLVFGFVNWYQNKYDTLPVFGGYDINEKGLSIAHRISKFTFENSDAKIFSSEAMKHKITVANFFFTSCAGICPNMMRHMKVVQDYFPGHADITFISFTVDPARDSAATLKMYAQEYHLNTSGWNLLTGDKKEIYKLARKSFYLSAGDGDGGANDFIHSEQLVLIDKTQHIRGYYSGTDDKAIRLLIIDIKKLEHEY